MKNPLLNSQGLAVSNQRSALSLEIKYFYHKQLIIKHTLIIKSNYEKFSYPPSIVRVRRTGSNSLADSRKLIAYFFTALLKSVQNVLMM